MYERPQLEKKIDNFWAWTEQNRARNGFYIDIEKFPRGCLDTLLRVFDFKGRSNKYQFWGYLIASCSFFIFLLTVATEEWPQYQDYFSDLAVLAFVPLLPAAIRRARDINRSPWWLVVPPAELILIPIVAKFLPEDWHNVVFLVGMVLFVVIVGIWLFFSMFDSEPLPKDAVLVEDKNQKNMKL